MDGLTLHVVRIHTVNGDTAFIDIIEFHKQVNNGCLTSTRRTNNSNLLSWLGKSWKIMNDSLFRSITKGNMVKDYLTLGICQLSCLGWLVVHIFFFQKFKDTTNSCSCWLELCNPLCNLRKRLWKDTNIGHEGYHITDGQASVNYLNSTYQADHDVTKVTDENHKWHHNTRNKLRLPHWIIELIIKPLEILTAFFRCIVARYNCLTCVDFFNVPINVSQIFLLALEKGLREAHDEGYQNKTYQDRTNRSESHSDIWVEHHNNGCHQENTWSNQGT